MSNSVNVTCTVASIDLLIRGITEIGLAIKDLRAANEKIRELENCQGQKVKVDYVIENEMGEKIGVRTTEQGHAEFVMQKETNTAKATIGRATQAYARLKILDEVKRKGYQSVKEEKLPNGSIRLVVEKWR